MQHVDTDHASMLINRYDARSAMLPVCNPYLSMTMRQMQALMQL